MSVSVDVSELREKTASFEPVAYLVTVGEHGAPHLVSVAPEWSDGGELRVSAGRTTVGNVAGGGSVTLLWAGRPGEDYCLIVDGAGRVDGDAVVIEPRRAVLHRLASASADLPSCVKVLDNR